jgi:hypothetical protein
LGAVATIWERFQAPVLGAVAVGSLVLSLLLLGPQLWFATPFLFAGGLASGLGYALGVRLGPNGIKGADWVPPLIVVISVVLGLAWGQMGAVLAMLSGYSAFVAALYAAGY